MMSDEKSRCTAADGDDIQAEDLVTDPTHRASVERYVTQARLRTYLAEVDDDYALAEGLYIWNLRASGAFDEVLGVFEVTLRNALCEELRQCHGKRTGTWLDDPTAVFDDRRIEQIEEAHRTLVQRGKPTSEGRVEALLTLRNRIAHHEPIHRFPLVNLHDRMLLVSAWIGPDICTWLAGLSRLPSLLATRSGSDIEA